MLGLLELSLEYLFLQNKAIAEQTVSKLWRIYIFKPVKVKPTFREVL